MATDAPVRWRTIFNVGPDTIPCYGLVQVVNIDGEEIINVQAVERNHETSVMVNGASNVLTQSYGQATVLWPMQVLWQASPGAGKPQPGEEWGLAAGEFALRRDRCGFIILSEPVGSVVLVQPATANRLALIQTTDEDGEDGRLGGNEIHYDPVDRSFTAVDGDIWVDPFQAGEVLSANSRYLGFPVGYDAGRPVYLVTGGFGEMIETTFLTNVCPIDPAIPDGSIGEAQLEDESITKDKIKNGEVLEAGDILDGGTF